MKTRQNVIENGKATTNDKQGTIMENTNLTSYWYGQLVQLVEGCEALATHKTLTDDDVERMVSLLKAAGFKCESIAKRLEQE